MLSLEVKFLNNISLASMFHSCVGVLKNIPLFSSHTIMFLVLFLILIR